MTRSFVSRLKKLEETFTRSDPIVLIMPDGRNVELPLAPGESPRDLLAHVTNNPNCPEAVLIRDSASEKKSSWSNLIDLERMFLQYIRENPQIR